MLAILGLSAEGGLAETSEPDPRLYAVTAPQFADDECQTDLEHTPMSSAAGSFGGSATNRLSEHVG